MEVIKSLLKGNFELHLGQNFIRLGKNILGPEGIMINNMVSLKKEFIYMIRLCYG